MGFRNIIIVILLALPLMASSNNIRVNSVGGSRTVSAMCVNYSVAKEHAVSVNVYFNGRPSGTIYFGVYDKDNNLLLSKGFDLSKASASNRAGSTRYAARYRLWSPLLNDGTNYRIEIFNNDPTPQSSGNAAVMSDDQQNDGDYGMWYSGEYDEKFDPKLVELFKELNRHFYRGNLSDNFWGDISWMEKYYHKLHEWYISKQTWDTGYDGFRYMIVREVADSMQHFVNNRYKDSRYSAAASIGMTYYIEMLRQYNEFSRLCETFTDDARRSLLAKEMIAWLRLQETMSDVEENFVLLINWGGNIVNDLSPMVHSGSAARHVSVLREDYESRNLKDVIKIPSDSLMKFGKCLCDSLNIYLSDENLGSIDLGSEAYKNVIHETRAKIPYLLYTLQNWIGVRCKTFRNESLFSSINTLNLLKVYLAGIKNQFVY